MVMISVLPRCWINEISEGKIELTDWIDMAAGFNCEGIEMYSLFLRSHDSKYLKSIKDRAESLGLSIPMMCHSPDFTIPERSARDLEIKKQIELIRVTSELGGKYCRTLSGQARPEVSMDEGKKWVLDSIEKCLPYAEKYGINLVIENHYKDGYWKYKEFAQKTELFLEIINQIDSPNFGVQFDPSNAIVAGDDPVSFLDKVILRIKTIHASDRYLAPGHKLEEMIKEDGTLGYPEFLIHGVTGQGLNDYDAIFSKLADNGFEGWISVEDGMNGFEEMKQSVEFLKIMAKKYFM